jgi:hypothetical protein
VAGAVGAAHRERDPVLDSTSSATGCCGMRTATVPRVSPEVPGQRRRGRHDDRQRAGPVRLDERLHLLGDVGGEAVQPARVADQHRAPACRGRGPLAASSRSTAAGENASAATP